MNFMFFTVIACLASFCAAGQNFQNFPKDNFMVGCNCKLRINKMHIDAAKSYNHSYPISSYVCAADEDNYETGTLNNITIQDISSNYKPNIIPSHFEKLFLQKYFDNLVENGITAEYVTYKGVRTIYYKFNMGETMPTEAFFFVKNKKAYLLQVSSRSDLKSKFQMVIGTFTFFH